MKVDHVLILAAGKGTRMGTVGKTLPKVLWPIFEKNLLSLQVEFAKKLVPDAKIFINLFHQKEMIEQVARNLDCELIKEEKVLDIGGGVHNLAKKLAYKGTLLILNGDQFLCFDSKYFESGLADYQKSDALLFSYQVNSNQLYNSLEIEGYKLLGITKNSELARNQVHQTYTGMSLIRLESLINTQGESKFFDSVANPQKQKVLVNEIKDVEYWDFGTLKRYCESMFKLCSEKDSLMRKFLIETTAFNLRKLLNGSYHSEHGINLTDHFIKDCKGSILLGGNIPEKIPAKSVLYGEVQDIIPEK